MGTLPPPESFVKRAIELGAAAAKVISPRDVFTAEWVRRKCQYGCGGYGRRLTCPPYSPTPQETRRMLDEYEVAIQEIIAQEREAFLSGYYKAFGMGAGPCRLCDVCDLEGGCKHPDKARPAMEACGIDVFKTARKAGFPIQVVRDYGCSQNCYGLLLD